MATRAVSHPQKEALTTHQRVPWGSAMGIGTEDAPVAEQLPTDTCASAKSTRKEE